MARLFLTGGSGMVGQNIRSHPRAVDWNILAPTSAELDLTDAFEVGKFIEKHKPDIVIHAAGRVGGIQANIANPVDFLDINNMIGRNVIMGAWKGGVRSFLNLASTCIYPAKAKNPLSEDMLMSGTLEPTNEGYALAKIMAMRLCEYINRQDPAANFKTLIPCNLYGPHDKFDPDNSHLLPAIIHKVHEAKTQKIDKVEIWGDGTARREFLYAPDLADAVYKAIDDLYSLPNSLNIGIGRDYSINEYYAITAQVLEWNGEFIHDVTRPVGMKQKLCNISRSEQWGWKAPTSLIDGIAKTYEFYCERYAK